MRRRGKIRVVVLALLSLPLLVAFGAAVKFHLHHRNNGTLVSSGVERTFLLHVPESYDASMPTPLVISLHGGGGWPAVQRDVSGWNRLADEHGFLVVYPASGKMAGTRGWRVVRPGPGLVEDVRFLADLMDHLEGKYNIDPTRIYVNGLSNGGAMASLLSCTLGERIAAVGVVASAQVLPWEACTDPRPLPWIAFHGTADRLVPYQGGTSWVSPNLPFLAVEPWTERQAERNGCDPEPVESTVAADVTRREYTGCARGAPVVLYTIRGGGHTWPGGQPLPEWFLGPTHRTLDATQVMWDFFQETATRGGPSGGKCVSDRSP